MDWRLPVGAIGICLFLFILGAAVITGGVMLLDSEEENSLPEGMDWAEGDNSGPSSTDTDNEGREEYPDSYFADAEGDDIQLNENPLPPKNEESTGDADTGGSEPQTPTDDDTPTDTDTPTETETPEDTDTPTETEEDNSSDGDSTDETTTSEPEETETPTPDGEETNTPEEDTDTPTDTPTETETEPPTETETPEDTDTPTETEEDNSQDEEEPTDTQEEEDVNKDSDGDGIPDRVSGNYDEYGVLADSDPDRKDVFIEIDYMEGTEIPRGELDEMKDVFANAPVSNPDGSEGITVHFIYPDDPVPSEDVTTIEEYHNNQHQDEFEYADMGVRHVLIVNDAAREDTSDGIIGGTQVGSDGIIVEHSEQEEQVVATTMHELGHSFGLLPRFFDGIDSSSYSVDEYRSVMNYNYPGCYECSGDKYGYSSGGEFDDWSVVEEDIDWFLEAGELEK